MTQTVPFKIKRQFGPDLDPYWENFEIPHSPNSNVISYLMDIRKNPVNADGIKVPPIVWDCSCLEEVCGTCTMRINGQVRQSCSALVDKLKWPITLEPMSKFPVNRDLSVDRSRMFDALKKVQAWVPVDGYHDLGHASTQFCAFPQDDIPPSCIRVSNRSFFRFFPVGCILKSRA